MKGASCRATLVVALGSVVLAAGQLASCRPTLEHEISTPVVAVRDCELVKVDWVITAGEGNARSENTLDIAVVLDESGSISTECPDHIADCYEAEKNFVKNLVAQLEQETSMFQNGGRAAWQEFSDWNLEYGPLKQHDAGYAIRLEDFNTGIDMLTYDEGYTAIGTGIEMATAILEGLPDKEDKNQVMLVITDGVENQGSQPFEKAEAARAQNITVFSVGITNAVNYTSLLAIADFNPANVFQVASFDELNPVLVDLIVQQIQTEACASGVSLDLDFADGVVPMNVTADAGLLTQNADKLKWKVGSVQNSVARLGYYVDVCSTCTMAERSPFLLYDDVSYSDRESNTLDTSGAALTQLEVKATVRECPGLCTGVEDESGNVDRNFCGVSLTEEAVLNGKVTIKRLKDGPEVREDILKGLSESFGIDGFELAEVVETTLTPEERRALFGEETKTSVGDSTSRALQEEEGEEVLEAAFFKVFVPGVLSPSKTCAEALFGFSQHDRFSKMSENVGVEDDQVAFSGLAYSQTRGQEVVNDSETQANGQLIVDQRAAVEEEERREKQKYAWFILAMIILLLIFWFIVVVAYCTYLRRKQRKEKERKAKEAEAMDKPMGATMRTVDCSTKGKGPTDNDGEPGTMPDGAEYEQDGAAESTPYTSPLPGNAFGANTAAAELDSSGELLSSQAQSANHIGRQTMNLDHFDYNEAEAAACLSVDSGSKRDSRGWRASWKMIMGK
ncbi:unnamed protein product [Chrysoparadoxa australica]